MSADTGQMPLRLDRRIDASVANDIAEGRLRVDIDPAARQRCDAAHHRLRSAIAERRHVYGLTTGFGPLANRLVDPAEGRLLQQNLVNHLASGLGAPLGWVQARAVVLARLMSILQGVSGASPGTVDALVTLLNSDLAPVLPERGTVGASGDLTPLAHMVLAFQGTGAFVDRKGHRLEGAAGLRRLGMAPMTLAERDGLALVNGTSAMTGIAVVNCRAAERLLDWSLGLTSVLAEVLGGRTEAWSDTLAKLRPHPGQILATRMLNRRLEGSTAVVRAPISDRRLTLSDIGAEDVAGQDAYTLRCAPQVLGAVADAMSWHAGVVETELSSVTDNPVFPESGANALHGGNFMGQHVALAADALTAALTVMAGLAERQVARLTDEKLNAGLPAFLHQGECGLNSGFMGAQVTATATLAELRAQGPLSVQSISTNGANQDVVSMGTAAARRAATTCVLSADILAILALAVVQAMELRGAPDAGGFSPSAQGLRSKVRSLSAPLSSDRPLSDDIMAMAVCIRNSQFPQGGLLSG